MSEQDVRAVYAAREKILVEALEWIARDENDSYVTGEDYWKAISFVCRIKARKTLALINPDNSSLVSAQDQPPGACI